MNNISPLWSIHKKIDYFLENNQQLYWQTPSYDFQNFCLSLYSAQQKKFKFSLFVMSDYDRALDFESFLKKLR